MLRKSGLDPSARRPAIAVPLLVRVECSDKIHRQRGRARLRLCEMELSVHTNFVFCAPRARPRALPFAPNPHCTLRRMLRMLYAGLAFTECMVVQ